VVGKEGRNSRNGKVFSNDTAGSLKMRCKKGNNAKRGGVRVVNAECYCAVLRVTGGKLLEGGVKFRQSQKTGRLEK
jgi:hypothetical protein